MPIKNSLHSDATKAVIPNTLYPPKQLLFFVPLIFKCKTCKLQAYRSADKSLDLPGRKQATVPKL